MKKIFDSAYGKDIAAFAAAILFSADTLKWDVMPFYFLFFGPLLAFLPRITSIYFSNKKKEDAEHAHIFVMFVLYFFIAMVFMGSPNSGEMFMRILISAAMYYIILWSFISIAREQRNKEPTPSKYTILFYGALLLYLFYDMYFTTGISSHSGIYRYLLTIIFISGFLRQLFLYNRSRHSLE